MKRISYRMAGLFFSTLLLFVLGCSAKQGEPELKPERTAVVSKVTPQPEVKGPYAEVKKALGEMESALDSYNEAKISYKEAADIYRKNEEILLENEESVEAYYREAEIMIYTAEDLIDDMWETLQTLDQSKEAFRAAEAYAAEGEYYSAYEFYGYVCSYDALYEKAQERQKAAKADGVEQAKKDAEAAAAQNDYETAILVLDVCKTFFWDDTSLDVLMEKYATDQVNFEVETLIEQADACRAEKDYASAYAVLRDGRERYPNKTNLETAFLSCEKEYVSYALEQASTVFKEKGDYNGAISILSLAQLDLPENEQINKQIEAYKSYRPVPLYELSPFYEEGGKLEIGEAGVRDNIGNTYSGYYRPKLYGWNKVLTVAYYINGIFDTISGKLFVWEESKNLEDSGKMEIYGDGKLLYQSERIGKGSIPVDFEVTISNTVELKIVFYAGNDSYSSMGILTGVNLQKDAR